MSLLIADSHKDKSVKKYPSLSNPSPNRVVGMPILVYLNSTLKDIPPNEVVHYIQNDYHHQNTQECLLLLNMPLPSQPNKVSRSN